MLTQQAHSAAADYACSLSSSVSGVILLTGLLSSSVSAVDLFMFVCSAHSPFVYIRTYLEIEPSARSLFASIGSSLLPSEALKLTPSSSSSFSFEVTVLLHGT